MTEVRVVAAEAFGAKCLRALVDGVGTREDPVIGLPTGNTPVALYETLRAAVTGGRLDISGWRPFAIDEYGGPRDHPCSNRAFFAKYWDVIPGVVPVEQFDPEAEDLEAECERMRAALANAGGLTVSLLGIGMNGHLAFNEPGSALDTSVRKTDLHEASRESARTCWGEKTPTWGLTLGLGELLSAPATVVMANGAAKAVIVARAVRGPETPDLPASFVRGKNALWLLDNAAASGLRG